MKNKLTIKERKFADKYLETGNASKAVLEAGYNVKFPEVKGSQLIRKSNVMEYIHEKQEEESSKTIASAKDVMEYLTKVMRGEIKDQFGLDAPLSERTKAATELAKRTVDIDNRLQGRADNVVEIKLDWSREE